MRSVPLNSEPGSTEISAFADLAHRPLLIVGNGPSSAMPPYKRIPGDAVIFRMNWFFLETVYHFGHVVDGWFTAIPNETLEKMLQEEIRSGRYDVRHILSPMRHAAHRDGDRYGLEPQTSGVPELDSWSVTSRHPRLARHFMSRPGLPTTGMQALSFGLGVGFREIYLSGVDLYESKDARYGYTVPQAVEASLREKDLTPGYEDNHGLDTDISFLRSCIAEFPDAEIHSVSSSETLHLYVPPAKELTERPHLTHEAAPRLATSKDTIEVELADVGEIETLTIPRVDGSMWKEINGRRCAYVTVVSGSYHHGARALANSLRRVSDVPLIALCTPDVDRSALTSSGIMVVDIPAIINPNTGGPRSTDDRKIQERFTATYTKLHVFRLDFLDRVVYLDSDAVVKQNVDELFAGDDFAAVPDAGFDAPTDQIFNSGVFVINPSYALFEQMISSLRRTDSYDGGDQGFLNNFFDNDWRRLPLEYNTTKRIYSHRPAIYQDSDVKILHYVGRKPWEPTSKGERYDQLDFAWLDNLTGQEKNELIRDLRHMAAAGMNPGLGTLTPLRQAQHFNSTKQPAQAIRVLEAAIAERNPTVTELRELARSYRRLGRHPEAINALKRATSSERPSPRLLREIWTTRLAGYRATTRRYLRLT